MKKLKVGLCGVGNVDKNIIISINKKNKTASIAAMEYSD